MMDKWEASDDELIEYFDNMCDVLNTKKIMFDEWEVFYKRIKDVIVKDIVKDKYIEYLDTLIYTFVYCEDYRDQRLYRREKKILRSFLVCLKNS